MPAKAFDRSVAAFRSTLEKRSAEAVTAIAEQRWDDAARVAHTIRGLSGNFGAARLAAVSVVLEGRLAENDAAAAADLAKEMVEVARQSVAALDPELDPPA